MLHDTIFTEQRFVILPSELIESVPIVADPALKAPEIVAAVAVRPFAVVRELLSPTKTPLSDTDVVVVPSVTASPVSVRTEVINVFEES